MIYFHLLLNPLQRALTCKFSRNCIYLPNINLSLYVPMLPCYHVLCYHVTMFHNAHDLILDHHAYSILLITIKPMQTSSVQLCYDFESNYLCPYLIRPHPGIYFCVDTIQPVSTNWNIHSHHEFLPSLFTEIIMGLLP